MCNQACYKLTSEKKLTRLILLINLRLIMQIHDAATTVALFNPYFIISDFYGCVQANKMRSRNMV